MDDSRMRRANCSVLDAYLIRTTPRASKRISFKFITELKEFIRFVSQFVMLFSTWTYSLFTTVMYTCKSFQIKFVNSQLVWLLICQSSSFSKRQDNSLT